MYKSYVSTKFSCGLHHAEVSKRKSAAKALTDITRVLRDEAALARAADELRHRWSWVA